ncbi:hypothetical protein SK128_021986 [Halocaridina rubra]|uniref:Uncharacterized protein n=1 Tax=Halocaridina rubra TaxID=373956 RepID=A0AAN8ZWP9_HALRR
MSVMDVLSRRKSHEIRSKDVRNRESKTSDGHSKTKKSSKKYPSVIVKEGKSLNVWLQQYWPTYFQELFDRSSYDVSGSETETQKYVLKRRSEAGASTSTEVANGSNRKRRDGGFYALPKKTSSISGQTHLKISDSSNKLWSLKKKELKSKARLDAFNDKWMWKRQANGLTSGSSLSDDKVFTTESERMLPDSRSKSGIFCRGDSEYKEPYRNSDATDATTSTAVTNLKRIIDETITFDSSKDENVLNTSTETQRGSSPDYNDDPLYSNIKCNVTEPETNFAKLIAEKAMLFQKRSKNYIDNVNTVDSSRGSRKDNISLSRHPKLRRFSKADVMALTGREVCSQIPTPQSAPFSTTLRDPSAPLSVPPSPPPISTLPRRGKNLSSIPQCAPENSFSKPKSLNALTHATNIKRTNTVLGNSSVTDESQDSKLYTSSVNYENIQTEIQSSSDNLDSINSLQQELNSNREPHNYQELKSLSDQLQRNTVAKPAAENSNKQRQETPFHEESKRYRQYRYFPADISVTKREKPYLDELNILREQKRVHGGRNKRLPSELNKNQKPKISFAETKNNPEVDILPEDLNTHQKSKYLLAQLNRNREPKRLPGMKFFGKQEEKHLCEEYSKIQKSNMSSESHTQNIKPSVSVKNCSKNFQDIHSNLYPLFLVPPVRKKTWSMENNSLPSTSAVNVENMSSLIITSTDSSARIPENVATFSKSDYFSSLTGKSENTSTLTKHSEASPIFNNKHKIHRPLRPDLMKHSKKPQNLFHKFKLINSSYSSIEDLTSKPNSKFYLPYDNDCLQDGSSTSDVKCYIDREKSFYKGHKRKAFGNEELFPTNATYKMKYDNDSQNMGDFYNEDIITALSDIRKPQSIRRVQSHGCLDFDQPTRTRYDYSIPENGEQNTNQSYLASNGPLKRSRSYAGKESLSSLSAFSCENPTRTGQGYEQCYVKRGEYPPRMEVMYPSYFPFQTDVSTQTTLPKQRHRTKFSVDFDLGNHNSNDSTMIQTSLPSFQSILVNGRENERRHCGRHCNNRSRRQKCVAFTENSDIGDFLESKTKSISDLRASHSFSSGLWYDSFRKRRESYYNPSQGTLFRSRSYESTLDQNSKNQVRRGIREYFQRSEILELERRMQYFVDKERNSETKSFSRHSPSQNEQEQVFLGLPCMSSLPNLVITDWDATQYHEKSVSMPYDERDHAPLQVLSVDVPRKRRYRKNDRGGVRSRREGFQLKLEFSWRVVSSHNHNWKNTIGHTKFGDCKIFKNTSLPQEQYSERS